MSVLIVRESNAAVSTLSIPTGIAGDEVKLRNHLENLARAYTRDRSFCFWMKLSGGGLKAYYRMAKGIESRTYTAREITEAIFHKKALFFHPAEQILNMLEEPMLAVA
jgi:hypothetical protein